MGANVVSAKFVIGGWAQGAWQAPGGSGVVSRAPAERLCAVAGPIRGEIPPNRPPAQTLRAAFVPLRHSVCERNIDADTPTDRRNISFPPTRRDITGRLEPSELLPPPFLASPVYHLLFFC